MPPESKNVYESPIAIVTGSGSGGGHKLMIKGIKNPPNEN